MLKRSFLVVVSAFIAISGCQPTRSFNGYVPDQVQPAEIEPGVDTRSSVLARLGSPSTTSTFNPDLWFYMSSTQQTLTYHHPKVVQRSIVAIQFDDSDQVADVLTYDLEDGKVIDFVSRETPARGRQLGILEQLFGTIGRLPSQLPGSERGPGQDQP